MVLLASPYRLAATLASVRVAAINSSVEISWPLSLFFMIARALSIFSFSVVPDNSSGASSSGVMFTFSSVVMAELKYCSTSSRVGMLSWSPTMLAMAGEVAILEALIFPFKSLRRRYIWVSDLT